MEDMVDRFRMMAASGAALLLAACALPPAKQAAPTLLAQRELGLGAALARPADAEWWRTFNDPQFEQLMSAALRDNPSLAQAAARLQQAEARWRNERRAALPGAALSAGETRSRIPDGFPEALAGGQSVWVGDLGVALDWDLDLWGRQADAIASAAALTQAAGFDAERARLMVATALSQAYLDLYRSAALADIATAAETQRRAILEITQKRVASGLDTRVELRSAEAAVPQAHQALLQAQGASEQAVHQLAALSGQGATAYAGIGRPQLDPDAVLPLPAELPLNLLARRPDVLAALARVRAADAQRAAARAAYYPAIGLRALAGFASFSIRDLIGASSFGYGFGGTFALPLFDGARLRAGYDGASAELAAGVATYNQTVLAAIRDVSDQLAALRMLAAQREQQQQVLTATEEAYRLAELRYRAGLSTYLGVLNAETQLLDARRQSVTLQVAQVQARIALLLQLGGSFVSPTDGSAPASAAATPNS